MARDKSIKVFPNASYWYKNRRSFIFRGDLLYTNATIMLYKAMSHGLPGNIFNDQSI